MSRSAECEQAEGLVRTRARFRGNWRDSWPRVKRIGPHSETLLREQLAYLNVNTMKPFSDFPFLKQAFTEGERWPVRPERIERLVEAKLITAEQVKKFLKEGAIGSHLENLQRKGGFKGFNQKSVSVIIEATDPRKQGH